MIKEAWGENDRGRLPAYCVHVANWKIRVGLDVLLVHFSHTHTQRQRQTDKNAETDRETQRETEIVTAADFINETTANRKSRKLQKERKLLNNNNNIGHMKPNTCASTTPTSEALE